MTGILTYLGGYGLSKIAPFILGMVVSNKYGPESYAQLLKVLVQANVLTSISTVGYVQLILTGGRSESETFRYALRCVLFALLVSIFGGLWAAWSATLPGAWGWLHSALLVTTYSFGNSTLGTLISLSNAKLRNAHAGALLLGGVVLPFLVGFGCIAVGMEDYAAFLAISCLLSIAAVAAFVRVNSALLFTTPPRTFLRLALQAIPLERAQVNCMVFVGAVLFSHSLIISRVVAQNDATLAAAFALGYQLFAIGISVPGILGNVVVPRLVRAPHGRNLRVGRLAVLYVSFALAWLIAVFLGEKLILPFYALRPSPEIDAIIRILQVAAVLAAVNALVWQRFSAKRQFGAMAFLAVLYSFLLLTFTTVFGSKATSAASGILAAYVMTLAAGVVLYRIRSAGMDSQFARGEADEFSQAQI